MRRVNAAVYLALAALAVVPVHADVQFHARSSTAKAGAGKQQCEIRLLVDKQVEVSLRGDLVSVHTLTGGDARDNGSECTAPMAAQAMDGFTFAVKKHHGPVKLVNEPSARNQFTATAFIHNNGPGEEAYELRISWNAARQPLGINSNNAIHSSAKGAGKAILGEAAPTLLGDVALDLDRGGNMVLSFQAGRAGVVTFTGTLISWEGGVLKMDARADARFQRLPGPLYVNFDASKQIYKITLTATDGQEQLRVNWERK